jgi:hypothetical protein
MMLFGEEAERAESAMAERLGRVLFAYSRLDVSLGLQLVWSDMAKELPSLTNRYSNQGVGARMDFLKKRVATVYAPDSDGGKAYADFFVELDALRQIRNDLVHGRWSPPLDEGQMACVVGLPTSGEQREAYFTSGLLDEVLLRLDRARVSHERLREQWPV